MALGESLFYDTRLSKNGRFSCATCHQPDKYFTDQIALSANIHGNPLPRNTPTLVNAAYQTTYFWDMRAWNLELQAKAVIDNALEMHGSIDSVCRLLNRDEKLLGQVREAYRNPDININAGLVTSLLAIYQRSLTGLNSPFDRYMLGNEQAISPDAVAGFNLFMGKAKCGTCHFIPLFSGLVPPDYNKMESEIIGTPSTRANHSLHNDSGRYHINPVPAYLHAFKTPTVRNASFTFPYMHNGVYHTLEEVVDFYNKGGGEGTGYTVPGQTLPSDPLNLTETESKQLVAFINSLTDEIGILSQVAKGK
jgi:cytochrome c peroxidase